MKEKRYPFSMNKHAHDIELARNVQWLKCRDMEDGTIPWDDEAFEWLDRLDEVRSRYWESGVVWVTGKDYGVLREASNWAQIHRAERNRMTWEEINEGRR